MLENVLRNLKYYFYRLGIFNIKLTLIIQICIKCNHEKILNTFLILDIML